MLAQSEVFVVLNAAIIARRAEDSSFENKLADDADDVVLGDEEEESHAQLFEEFVRAIPNAAQANKRDSKPQTIKK